MKISWKAVALCMMTTLLLGEGCAGTVSKAELQALMTPDPNLPSIAEVDSVGLLAVQQVIATDPQTTTIIQSQDTAEVTRKLVDAIFKLPTEQVVSDSQMFKVALYSLSHQWGRTQLELDKLNRQDLLLKYRAAEFEEKKSDLNVSNMTNAFLSGAIAGQNSNQNTTLGQRYSNERNLDRNIEIAQRNAQEMKSYDIKLREIQENRLNLAERKRSLAGYSDLLGSHSRYEHLVQSKPEQIGTEQLQFP